MLVSVSVSRETAVKLIISHVSISVLFQYYRCIFLIPDIYNRQHVKEMVNMLLVKMGFSGMTCLHVLFIFYMSDEFSKQNYPVMVKTIFHLHTLHKQRPHVCVLCVCSCGCASGVGVCDVGQWSEQCVCCGRGRSEDQCLLC